MENRALPHLLITDDDHRLRRLLSRYLKDQGFHVTVAQSAKEAREFLAYAAFDLLILDVMMPEETGLSLAASLLERPHFQTPILLLTAMGEVPDRIQGLKVGVDDYVTKPFEPMELLLRIQAILKRTQKAPPTDYVAIGPHRFDPVKLLLYKEGVPLSLTQVEANLLTCLLSHSEIPVSREVLGDALGLKDSLRTVDVQITRLRRKVERDPKNPQYLQTIRHVGYVLWLQ